MAELVHELVEILELTIHTREADIGDLIKAVQLAHHQFADTIASNFTITLGQQQVMDAVDGCFEGFRCNWALFGSDLHTLQNLPPIERLGPTILLEHAQGFFAIYPFIGGKTLGTGITHPAAADGGAIVGRPGVDHAIIVLLAEWAAHWGSDVRLRTLMASCLFCFEGVFSYGPFHHRVRPGAGLHAEMITDPTEKTPSGSPASLTAFAPDGVLSAPVGPLTRRALPLGLPFGMTRVTRARGFAR